MLVGVAAISQRCEDPADALEPLSLFTLALQRAAEDAGSRALLARADRICAPRGFWSYSDPCRFAAERFGAAKARTLVSEIGVLQTTLLGRAAAAIASGEADVVLVGGAEARFRAQRAQLHGGTASQTTLPTAPPDEVLRPQGEIVSAAELRAGLGQAVAAYAMIENAFRAAGGASFARQRDELAALQAAFARVAAANPDAWVRHPPDGATLADPERNPFQAFPYGRLHCAQWNVDQAVGLVFCSAATARRLGVPRARWIFPRAVAEANAMTLLSERRVLHRCPGLGLSGRRALSRGGVGMSEVAHRELYSCFPIAVRLQLLELGITDVRPPTVTGGMAFAGGPLNHFSLQALAKLARVLRGDPGSLGYLSAVSGFLTKQGASLWSSEPGDGPFAYDDVSREAAEATPTVPLAPGAEGRGAVATYTVLHEGGAPVRAVFLCDLEDGRRTLAHSADRQLASLGTQEELCGRRVRIRAGQAALS